MSQKKNKEHKLKHLSKQLGWIMYSWGIDPDCPIPASPVLDTIISMLLVCQTCSTPRHPNPLPAPLPPSTQNFEMTWNADFW